MRGVGQHPPVVDEPEPGARAQHAVDLWDRGVVVEPVERLRHEDGVGGRVRKRDPLGRAGQGLRGRSYPP